MNLLFWNLCKNNNSVAIVDLIKENKIDLAVFAEYSSTNFQLVRNSLLSAFTLYDGYGGCTKITLIARNEYKVSILREQNYYSLYKCTYNGFSYLLAGVHLPAMSQNVENRKNIIRALVQDIKEQEVLLKNNNTIVIGDFNASPFDDELIQKDSFNAVLFRNVIMKRENDIFCGKKYQRFYNPMINYITEATNTYGSYYFSTGSKPLYWYCLDQVLVRKALVDNINNLFYCKCIKGRNLIKDIAPNKTISDHLPLIVEFL